MRFHGGIFRKPGSRFYYVATYDAATGKRSHVSTRCSTAQAAREWLEAARARAFLGGTPAEVVGPGPSLEAATASWLAAKRAQGLDEAHVRGLGYLASRWALRWPSRPLAAITREECRAYLELRSVGRYGARVPAPATLENERRALRSFFGWALGEEFIARNPMATIRAYRVRLGRPRVLTEEEAQRLLGACRGSSTAQVAGKRQGGGPAVQWTQRRPAPAYLAPVVLIAMDTGLRSRAILGLRWAHLELEGGWIHLPAELMKGGEAHSVPLSPEALEALRAWRKLSAQRRGPGSVAPGATVWGLSSRASVKRAFRSAVKRAALEGVTFHDLRRTFISRARRRGVPLDVVMAISDHRDIRTVMKHYRGVSPEELLRAVGRREGGEEGAVNSNV